MISTNSVPQEIRDRYDAGEKQIDVDDETFRTYSDGLAPRITRLSVGDDPDNMARKGSLMFKDAQVFRRSQNA